MLGGRIKQQFLIFGIPHVTDLIVAPFKGIFGAPHPFVVVVTLMEFCYLKSRAELSHVRDTPLISPISPLIN